MVMPDDEEEILTELRRRRDDRLPWFRQPNITQWISYIVQLLIALSMFTAAYTRAVSRIENTEAADARLANMDERIEKRVERVENDQAQSRIENAETRVLLREMSDKLTYLTQQLDNVKGEHRP